VTATHSRNVRAWQILAMRLNTSRASFAQPRNINTHTNMSFKFGLNIKNKATGVSAASAKPPLAKKKKKLLLEDDEGATPIQVKATAGVEAIGEFNFDEIAPTLAPEKSASKQKPKPTGPPTRKPVAREDDPTTFTNSASAQEAEIRAKEATEVDASIYDYDAAYDVLHAVKLAKKAAQNEDDLEQRSKYMDNLLEAAELRKKDQLRAKDKLIQRERKAEGDEFADKDKFVTGAYKAQQEEARKAEVEEKLRQAAEEENRRKFGMLGFHKQRLMEEEKRHREAMEAAAEVAKSGIKIDAEEEKEKTEAQIVRELQAQGRDITLNEEGQVADKRQLLSAGLNILAKPKKPTTTSTSASRPAGSSSSYQGRNATQRDIRARHTQMVAEQIEQAAKRKADEDAEEQRKLQHASKSQKTEGEISSAKERYLQRKREAAAAKVAATGK
jgi:coiled-coil domain-containing protein 55